jgi:hypothetical protein
VRHNYATATAPDRRTLLEELVSLADRLEVDLERLAIHEAPEMLDVLRPGRA